MDNAKVQSEYKVRELSIDWGGYNYLVIYGSHINGGFCSIPNWNVSCEMGFPMDSFYNMECLSRVLKDKDTAKAIADAIESHEISREQTEDERESIDGMVQYIGRQGRFKQVVVEVGTQPVYEKANGVGDDDIMSAYTMLKEIEKVKRNKQQSQEKEIDKDMER